MTPGPRILAVAWAFSDWQNGGEPIGAYELVSHLARQGATVDVVTAAAPLQTPPPPGVRVHVAPGASPTRRGNTGRNKAAMVAEAQRLVAANRYDLMHVVTQFTSFPPLVRPFVISGCHNVAPIQLRRHGRAARFGILMDTLRTQGLAEALGDLAYAARWERGAGFTLDRTLREADLVILRERVGVDAYADRARRVEYVPFGVNPGPAPAPGRRRDGSVLFVGRLEADKGVDVLLDAFARIAPDHPGARLKVVGAGREDAALRAQAQRLGIAARTEFLGHVPREALRPLYEAASVFVLPSLGESFGQVNLEAMAAGTPVVTTPMVAAAPDYVVPGQNGELVAAGDAAALAKALTRILGDPDLVERMGSQARAASLAYDWRDVARRHLDLYASLAPQR